MPHNSLLKVAILFGVPDGSDGDDASVAAQCAEGYAVIRVKSDSQRLLIMRVLAAWGMSFDVAANLLEVRGLIESGERTPDFLVVDEASSSIDELRTLTDGTRTTVGQSLACIVLENQSGRLPGNRLPAGVCRIRGGVSARSVAECIRSIFPASVTFQVRSIATATPELVTSLPTGPSETQPY